MQILSYRDLEVWQLSMELVEAVYDLTALFPPDERYGLTAQLRRAVIGVPSNISEGHPQSTAVYRKYLRIAVGSQSECGTQLELARRLKLAPDEKLAAVIETNVRVRQMLYGLLRSL